MKSGRVRCLAFIADLFPESRFKAWRLGMKHHVLIWAWTPKSER